jgi:hypothetical protein
MSLIIPANSLAGGGYAVDNSLRFNSGSSDYLNKSFGSAGDRTTWTLSFWTKRSSLSNTNQIFAKYTDGSNQDNFYFNTSNQFFWQVYNTGQTGRLITNSVYRDISAWYHVVCVWDTSNATAGDRMRLYINGEQVTSFATEDQASLNADSNTNNSGTFTIGEDGNGSNFYNGYMAETYFIDGQALAPTDFGEFDADSGVWKPIVYEGTYGTNGFFLEFQDSGALGTDSSGEGNNFTVNNLTSIDQTTDTPTNNFCTGSSIFANNEANVSPASFSNGNTTYTTTVDGWTLGRGTFGISSGKWYMEAKVTKTGDGQAGNFAIVPDDTTDTNGTSIGLRVDWFGVTEVVKINAGSNTTTFTDLATGNILKLAVDLDNGKLWIGKNDTWWNNNNSSATLDVSNPDVTGINTAITYLISLGGYRNSADNNTWDLNFGNPPFTISSGNADANGYGNFEYAVPSGYLSLCTKNLSEVLG